MSSCRATNANPAALHAGSQLYLGRPIVLLPREPQVVSRHHECSGMRPSLRWYQAEAVNAICQSLDSGKRTLYVLATAAGKTTVFSEVARRYLDGRRVLVLAHRKELVYQAAERLQQMTGIRPGIEMAEEWSSIEDRIVCGSLQTVMKRLERWDRDHFGLVIGDELHHFPALTYRKVWDYFQAMKLGCTATPDRGDKKAMGQIVDHVAYTFDIIQGIEQGYLVPIIGKMVQVNEIDLSNVSKSAGDLQAGQLDEVMVKNVEGVISKTLELEPDRQGVWFWPGVASAEAANDRLNALRPGSSGFVCAATPPQERAELFRDFRSKKIQHLHNVGIATEGVDIPSADMVVMARPTLSRALYTQCAGRGLRVLPGLVDGIPGKQGASERRALIAGSAKPNCVILDFVGNSGKHTLVTPEDILGGDFTEEEKRLAKKLAKEKPGADVIENLIAARAQLKAAMAKMRSKVKAQVEMFDPFKASPKPVQVPPMNPHQRKTLERMRFNQDDLKGLDQEGAAKLIKKFQFRASRGLASHPQLKVLKKYGVTKENLYVKDASKMIDYIASTGWKPDAAVLKRMGG